MIQLEEKELEAIIKASMMPVIRMAKLIASRSTEWDVSLSDIFSILKEVFPGNMAMALGTACTIEKLFEKEMRVFLAELEEVSAEPTIT